MRAVSAVQRGAKKKNNRKKKQPEKKTTEKKNNRENNRTHTRGRGRERALGPYPRRILDSSSLEAEHRSYEPGVAGSIPAWSMQRL